MDGSFYRIDVQDGITTNPAALDYPGFLMYMSVYNHDSQAYYDNRFMPFRKLEYAPAKTLAKTVLGSKYWIPHDGSIPMGYNWYDDDFAINSIDIGLGFASNKRINAESIVQENTFIQDIMMFNGIIDSLGTDDFNGHKPNQVIENGENPSLDVSLLSSGYFLIDYSRTNPYTACTIEYTRDGEVLYSMKTDEYGYTSAPIHLDAKKVYFYCSNLYYAEEHVPIDVYVITESDVEALYDQLNSFDYFTNVINETDFIKADIKVTKDESLVFTNLPYDKGWKVSVDGVDVETRAVNIAFVGFDISKGSHQIEFRYIPPGIVLGASVSSLSLLIVIAIILYERKKKKNIVY